MIRYLRAEHLKFKKSFSRKMLLVVPVLVLLFSFFMNPMYTVTNTFNWWSIFFMPLVIALLSGLSHQKEERSIGYNRIFSLPVSLSKVWYAKVIVIAGYTLGMLIFFELILLLFQIVMPIGGQWSNTLLAVGLLWLGTLWQIPFCLWLARKWGLVTALLVNAVGGIGLGTYLAPLPIWWINPWSWAIRMMCPTIGVHPNGVPLAPGDTLWNPAVISIGAPLALVLFALVLLWTGSAFAGVARSSRMQTEVN
ncbi:lantibiotic immunity ABC transporter MutE/EpiE family permease subunit [Paenibacillus hunanensis]|uniref:ABC-2 type transport system permease protein n=1 Tax=Paenibacillus hunanensis TaxID=539262 RepID=A0ABU1J0R3_9BACL|nr:lantibiotic immunity ABC transporter MutE/EpiE family permease subunit [Paenibacillus hunanensis]MDR6244850.1 ABC-2 type transport system permease protein [Paenibacillus hunanensis]GGJ04628.1 multidrug ABC transporter permease [Paenibacillus hunanensis]